MEFGNNGKNVVIKLDLMFGKRAGGASTLLKSPLNWETIYIILN